MHSDDNPQVIDQAASRLNTSAIQGHFSNFKRGMKRIYQRCGKKHLYCYVAEFDFRYNNRTALGVGDTERAHNVMKGIERKRLTYWLSNEAAHA